MYALREVQRGNYDDRGYSNEETIAHLMLSKPSEINSTLTYTFGMDDDRFPLIFLFVCFCFFGVVDITTVDWTWKTMGRMKFNDTVLWFNNANTTPGKGGAFFDLLRGYLPCIAINLAFTLMNSRISKTGHVGGLVGGYLTMYIMYLLKVI